MNEKNRLPLLDESRARIDALDKKLLELFVQRMEAVRDVADYKRAHQLQIFHPAREQELLAARAAVAPTSIRNYAQSFFSHLMESSKCYQVHLLQEPCPLPYHLQDPALLFTADTTVAYSAADACDASALAHRLCLPQHSRSLLSYRAVFEQVLCGNVSFGLVPILSATAGSVKPVYKLLHEIEIYVNHTYVVHTQQPPTAHATDQIIKFALISNRLLTNDLCNEISLCITLPDAHGELNRLITKFALYHISLNKIETLQLAGTPDPNKPFVATLYLHMQGNLCDQNIKEIINDLQFNSYDFRVIGAYGPSM